MKLLIVDDEPIIRKGIKRLVDFEALGIEEVYEGTNGQQAFELYKAHRPEIILADINMPKMNGLEFSEKVKHMDKSVKIALITGYDYFDYAQKAIKLGVEDYILKPVSSEDIRQLLHKLTTAVREERASSEAAAIAHRYQTAYGSPEDEGYQRDIITLTEEGVSDPSFSLTVLAEKLGLSTGYTSGLFKKYFEMTFKEYLMSKRLDKAKILLLSTDMKNYEISEAIGFADPNYFSTAFKKYTNMSPGKYREKARDGQ